MNTFTILHGVVKSVSSIFKKIRNNKPIYSFYVVVSEYETFDNGYEAKKNTHQVWVNSANEKNIVIMRDSFKLDTLLSYITGKMMAYKPANNPDNVYSKEYGLVASKWRVLDICVDKQEVENFSQDTSMQEIKQYDF